MKNSEYLKVMCRDHHDRIESSLDLMKICTDRNLYRNLLNAFAGFYREIEKELSFFQHQLSTYGIYLEERLKLKMILMDLKSLEKDFIGEEQSEDNFGPHRIKIQIKAQKKINNIHQAMGTLYVLEGSTLGAQIIYSQLIKHQMIGPQGEGGRFFLAYGQNTSQKWNQFKAALDTFALEDRCLLLKAAQETFEDLRDYLARNLELQR